MCLHPVIPYTNPTVFNCWKFLLLVILALRTITFPWYWGKITCRSPTKLSLTLVIGLTVKTNLLFVFFKVVIAVLGRSTTGASTFDLRHDLQDRSYSFFVFGSCDCLKTAWMAIRFLNSLSSAFKSYHKLLQYIFTVLVIGNESVWRQKTLQVSPTYRPLTSSQRWYWTVPALNFPTKRQISLLLYP